ncbi:MAG: MFS transporter [Phycisphaerales bacterium]|nr:MFS transporter [Phycisphaerales bacterium]
MKPRAALWNHGFASLLTTQFFEAACDNLVKGALAFAIATGGPWNEYFGAGGNGLVALLFALPFILLSAFGGRVADRCSKSRLTIYLKSLSFIVAGVALIGFSHGLPMLALTSLIFFAIVSAFFGPVKYGMIAELVAPEKLVRANGVINMATNVAVICGGLLAGIVSVHWKGSFVDGAPVGIQAYVPGFAILALVIGGFITCLTLPKLQPQNPTLPINLNPFSTYITTIREMKQTPLLAICVAWTYFYFAAAVVLVVLPDYSTFLSINDDWNSYLMAAMGAAIGIGCITAAYADHEARRSTFVVVGAFGLGAVFLALGLAPPSYPITMCLLIAMGLVAGFYIIPLQSMLQIHSPDKSRGRVLGTANGMSFAMGAVGGAMFYGLRTLGMPSNRVFLVVGLLTLIVGVLIVRWNRAQLRQTLS